MEQKLETKLAFRDKLHNFYQLRKGKIISLIFVLIILIIASVFIQQKKAQNNILIAEKYVLADLKLSQNKTTEANKLLNEIMLSKNKFYTILALNKIIEKNLINNDEKILEYFDIIENLDLKEEELDLIIFKKALYLLKMSKNLEGKKLLEKLVNKESKFKKLAEEFTLN